MPVVNRILQSMKVGEVTSSVVRANFVLQQDPVFAERNSAFDRAKPLTVNIALLKLRKVADLYRDQTVMYHQL